MNQSSDKFSSMRQILGKEVVDGILRDCGEDWAVFATIAMIEGNGGPKNDLERDFIIQWDKSH